MKCRFSQRFRLFSLGTALIMFALLLSACGGSDTTASSTGGSNSSTTTGSASNSTTGSSAACDPLTKVTFTEKLTPNQPDQYLFDPKTLSVKTGQYISFINQTDEVHTLVTTPDAGLDNSTIDKNETQPVQFMKAGVYTVESQNAQHRGSAQVTVSSQTGTTCGMTASNTNVTFSEKITAGKPDQYSFSPDQIKVQKGQGVTFLNQTDEEHTLVCTPDAGLDAGALKVDKNEKQLVNFPKVGQYVCSSMEHPDAKITVIAQ